MNDRFDRQHLDELLDAQGSPLVSLYMPAHRVTVRIQEDVLQFKNLLKTADEQLAAAGLRTPDITRLLAPAQEMVARVDFWQRQSDGLAAFLASGSAQVYRLPLRFEPLVAVGKRFHIKPLLPLLADSGGFYIIAVSQNAVRLLVGTRDTVDEVDLATLPSGLADTLRYDDIEKQLQFRSAGASAAGRGRSAVLFHGHGGGATDEQKEQLARYFREIDEGLRDTLRQDHAPLVFAGVDYLFPIYQQVNTYPHLLPTPVIGNPDDLRPDQLHAAAWPVVAPVLTAARDQAVADYQALAGTGRTTAELADLLAAAAQGRIAVAFLRQGDQLWGDYAPEAETIAEDAGPRPDNQDLYDLLAAETLRRGGRVFVLASDQMPAPVPAAAIYRY